MTLMLFYLFSAFAVLSCLGVILSSQAVTSILLLVFAYLNVAGIFITIGADFVALMLMVVYVGAVAVLFLFVVMMLDTDAGGLKKIFHEHAALILFQTSFFIFLLIYAYQSSDILASHFPTESLYYKGNAIKDIGRVLYTDYALYFQLSGFILLLAMIGAIALTLRVRPGVRKQNIHEQVMRCPEQAVQNVQISPHAALKDDI